MRQLNSGVSPSTFTLLPVSDPNFVCLMKEGANNLAFFDNPFDPTYLTCFESHFDAMRMIR